MKHRLLLFVAAGTFVATGTAVWVLACEKDSKTAAAASHTTCTAAQAAACNAKGASAVTADARGSGTTHGVTAVTADTKLSCAAHGVTAATVSTTDAKGSCATKSANAAGTKGSCAGHGASASAHPAGSGYTCGGRGMTATADRYEHESCDACADMHACDGELKASGATTQTVKLKNGIMYIYTTSDPSKARAVQAAVAQRNERLASTRTETAKLCPDCKLMRGAMASGKLSREMVSIDGGCLTLVTSSDPSIVRKLHAILESHGGETRTAENRAVRSKI